MAIDRAEVGANVLGNTANFGVYLPGIKASDGFAVNVRLIHRADQFKPEIPSQAVPLIFNAAHPLGLWSLSVDVTKLAPSGHFGQVGQYLYRFELWRSGGLITKHFSDPFANCVGPGFLSAFTIGPTTPFPWSDGAYRTPALDDLVAYELHAEEFNSTLDGIIERLDYLQGLGVNCLEIMPINPIKRGFDWGYGPIGYFACEEAFGGNDALKRLVDACHARDMAANLDVVFGHSAGDDFPYARVYDDTGLPNPMMQSPNRDQFGRGVEWSHEFSQQYFLEVTKHLLDEFHVDGFRYDNVPGYYDGAVGQAYAKLAYDTYRYSQAIPRFENGTSYSRIIQCAEFLDEPPRILRETYSSCTWQDGLLGKAQDMAKWSYVDDVFAHLLDPSFLGYPKEKDASATGDEPFPVAPFQYLESHDHSRFIATFGLDSSGQDELLFGNRELFFKTQAYAIALMTSAGVPMLFQGQEFAENYVIPGGGNGRVGIRRGVHWEYFYDENGQALVKLYRRLGFLRRTVRALRSRAFYYYNALSPVGNRIIIYRRDAPATAGLSAQTAIVVVNFSDQMQTVNVPLPVAGIYTEMLDLPNRASPQTLTANAANQAFSVQVNGNYGGIFVLGATTSVGG